MHGALSRRIVAAEEVDQAAIDALRQFYENKFIELTQAAESTKLTQWILL